MLNRSIAITGLIGVLTAGSSAQSKATSFILAVYSGDNLLPIARYTGARWLNTWPGADDDDVKVPALKNIPADWLGRRVPQQWTVWFTTGKTATVHIKGTQRYGGCVSPPALSVAEELAPPAGTFDEQHPGVAVDTAQPVEPISRLSGGAEWDAIRPVAMAAAERIGGRASELRWLYRAGASPRSPTYFFETGEVKSDESGTSMVVHGWILRNPGGLLTAVGADLFGCGNEEKDVLSCLIPIGAVRIGGRTIWLLEYPLGETDTFELWDVGSTNPRRILTADAGGC